MGRTGVWLIGAQGSLASTVVTGARAIARGLAGRGALVTELPELRGLAFVGFEDLVFGGWDIAPTGLLARAPLSPPLNLVISNVPGPREPLYCVGAKLMAYYPVSTIVDGVGLNITVLSYRDHIDVGIIADRDQLDDAWPMLEGMRAALEEFYGLLSARAAESVPPPVLVSP